MVLPKRKKVNPILTIDSQDWSLIGSNSTVDTLRISKSSSGAIFLELLLLEEVKESLVFMGLEILYIKYVKELLNYTLEHPNLGYSIPELKRKLHQGEDEMESDYKFDFECEYNGAVFSVEGISISFGEEDSLMKLFIGAEVFVAIVNNWDEHKIEVINHNQRLMTLGATNAELQRKEENLLQETNELIEKASRLSLGQQRKLLREEGEKILEESKKLIEKTKHIK
jgi:hypothetical protein